MIGSSARALLILLVVGVLLGCSQNNARPEGSNTSIVVPHHQISSGDEATLLVSAAIRSNKLTTLPDECLQYSATSTGTAEFLVEVRENHRSQACGGDPLTAPRLFDVLVHKNTGAMKTNANADRTAFHPLPPGR